jgi:hypothetical protein
MKRKISIDLNGEFTQAPKDSYKAKAKVWDDTMVRDYWKRRDEVILKDCCDSTKVEIEDRYKNGKLE